MYSEKSASAYTGALEPTAPTTDAGYFSLSHNERSPGYEPPKETHGLAAVGARIGSGGSKRAAAPSVTAAMKAARSANACSDERYCRLAFDMSGVGHDSP